MRHLLVFLSVIVSYSCLAQSKELNLAITDFCNKYSYVHKHSNNALVKEISYLSGYSINYENWQIERAIDNLEKDINYRNSLLKNWGTIKRFHSTHIVIQFMNFGVEKKHAFVLAKYIIDKYESGYNPNDYILTSDAHKESTEEEIGKSSIVNTMPEFKGGAAALKKYLLDNIIYPNEAYNNKIEGRVTVAFTIDTNGNVSDSRIIKGEDIGYGIPEEAIRVIRNMPKWNPARTGMKAVTMNNSIPINFTLPKNKDIKTLESIDTMKIPYGLRKGLSLDEVIKINGKDFKIYGFEWDEAGLVADYNNGKLEGLHIAIYFEVPTNLIYEKYSKYVGDGIYSSADKGLKKLGLTISRIEISK